MRATNQTTNHRGKNSTSQIGTGHIRQKARPHSVAGTVGISFGKPGDKRQLVCIWPLRQRQDQLPNPNGQDAYPIRESMVQWPGRGRQFKLSASHAAGRIRKVRQSVSAHRGHGTGIKNSHSQAQQATVFNCGKSAGVSNDKVRIPRPHQRMRGEGHTADHYRTCRRKTTGRQTRKIHTVPVVHKNLDRRVQSHTGKQVRRQGALHHLPGKSQRILGQPSIN